MTWQEYEAEVLETLKLYYPDAIVRRNIKINGYYSKKDRQIDILIEETIGGKVVRIFVECKYYNKTIDVKTVESFISMAADVQADIALLVTEKGYSKTALNRAYYDPAEIELDILSLSELKYFQSHMAFPYAGSNGVVLLSPFGWIIDGTRRLGMICTLYQKGLTLEEAGLNKEFAYINCWDRTEKHEGLDDLILLQEENMRNNAQLQGMTINSLKYLEAPTRSDGKTKIRYADIKGYPALEITGFVEFDEFIFFCVLFTEEVNLKRNLRKMNTIIRMIVPFKIEIRTK